MPVAVYGRHIVAITAAMLGLPSDYGFDWRIAKLAAIVLSFQVANVLRQKVVFS